MEDRSWMYQRKTTFGRGMNPEFVAGVYKFIEFATSHCNPQEGGEIRCPCSSCKNKRFYHKDIIITHLYRKGFVPGYTNWSCHGEPSILLFPPTQIDNMCGRTYENSYHEMVMDGASSSCNVEHSTNVEEPPNSNAQKLYEMLNAVDTPLWDGCVNHSIMSVVARLLHIKAENNMSEKCFNQIAQLMKEVLPPNNKLPTGGSISFPEHELRMKQQKGESYEYHELWDSLHTVHKEIPNKGQFIDERAKKTCDKFDDLLKESQISSSSSNNVDEKTLFIEAAGGMKKGHIYGFGSESKRLKKGHISSTSQSSQPESTRIENLQNEVSDLKQQMKDVIRGQEEILKELKKL